MLRKLGTLLLLGLVWAGSAAAQSGNSGTTQVVLTNALHYTVANGKFLSGVYECSEGGYIDISCLLGQFPAMNCPAGQAIQSIDSSLNASCINVGAGSGPAGADTYVQYNASGIFGADANFTWNYASSILTLGGGGPGEATFSGDLLANLGSPSDGTIAYCSECNTGSDPCITGGTGAFAARLNGAWVCLGAGTGGGTITGSGTAGHMTKWTSSTAIGDSEALEDGTTLTVTGLDFKYDQALYMAGMTPMSSSVAAGATDRMILCTSGSSTDKTYTLPAATGSGRVIDVLKVDSGTNSCKITVPSGALNSGTTVILPFQWFGETCYDEGSGQWYCRGQGGIT